MDTQVVIVAVAAGAAAVHVVRRALLQFRGSDDEPRRCQGCSANRIECARAQSKDDVR